jgi:hypothetical protein
MFLNDEFRIAILVKNGAHQDFGKLTLVENMDDEFIYLTYNRWRCNPPIDKIIECRYSPTWPNHWQFSRFRPDKNTANFITVYQNIMESIKDNISEEQATFGLY